MARRSTAIPQMLHRIQVSLAKINLVEVAGRIRKRLQQKQNQLPVAGEAVVPVRGCKVI